MAARKKRTTGSRGRAAAKNATKDPGEQIDTGSAAVEWYTNEMATFELLANKVEGLLREVLDAKGLSYHSVTSRAKSLDSFATKAAQEKYTDPREQIKDTAGVRVIAYVDADAKRIASAIEPLFEVDPDHSSDASLRLGVDKMGYRSTHYVCRFSGDRSGLPEYKKFAGMEFEIQIRTILQHGWAEINHDRNYKFAGVLPDDMQRRFNVLAGVLEMADREFDSIAAAIDSYTTEVADKAQRGDLDIEINSTSLKEYLLTKFKDAVKAGLRTEFSSPEKSSEVVQELHDFGVSRLSELEHLIPEEFPENVDLLAAGSFMRILRILMIMADEDRYFEQAWKFHWQGLRPGDRAFGEELGLDMGRIASRVDKLMAERETPET